MTDSILYVSLKANIEGLPKESDFELKETLFPELKEGQFIAENHFVSVDPGMRSRLSGVRGYAPPVKPGEVVSGFSIGRVLDSRSAAYKKGDMVTMGGGWASHSIFGGVGFAFKLPKIDIPRSLFLGILGIPGMTSYFGLKRIGRFQQGDHVLVTSAAGPVGATAGQLAKHWGAASVTGIAGSEEKCTWLTEKAGFDAAINYKTESDLAGAIAVACPEGVDVLFDNVGNAMIDTVLPMMRLNGRIIVSGQTADYSVPLEERHGIKNTIEFIAKRLLMQGLVVFDDIPNFPEAQSAISELIRQGVLIYEEEIFEGLETLPLAFCGLFKGESFGRRLVKVGGV
jgi:NADPH-dependent curcumin reductase CurA